MAFVWDIEFDLVLVWVSKSTSLLCAGRNLLVFSASMQIDLVFVWVVEIDLISIWGIELDLFSVQG